jgi:hypothetical protein
MKECPACLPPDNEGCATCSGTSEVTEEVYSQFMTTKSERESVMDFSRKIQQILYSNNNLEQMSLAIKAALEEQNI